MQQLRVDVDQAFAASRALGNDAVELGEELDNLMREWDNLARGWSGIASSTYSNAWAEWLEGAVTLVDALAERSRTLGRPRFAMPSKTVSPLSSSARFRRICTSDAVPG